MEVSVVFCSRLEGYSSIAFAGHLHGFKLLKEQNSLFRYIAFFLQLCPFLPKSETKKICMLEFIARIWFAALQHHPTKMLSRRKASSKQQREPVWLTETRWISLD